MTANLDPEDMVIKLVPDIQARFEKRKKRQETQKKRKKRIRLNKSDMIRLWRNQGFIKEMNFPNL